MVPLETLDGYMMICGILGVLYILLMLGILICFLRKYNCGSLNNTSCQQIELRTVTQPYQYTAVTQSTDSISHSCATRSNRSFSTKQSFNGRYHPHIKKPCFRTIPDFSQMERLATLWKVDVYVLVICFMNKMIGNLASILVQRNLDWR